MLHLWIRSVHVTQEKEYERTNKLTLRHASARVGKNAGEAKPADILHDLNFTISPGEFVGVLGPSGCGKSSLIQRLAGLAEFTSGEMLVNGVACSRLTTTHSAD